MTCVPYRFRRYKDFYWGVYRGLCHPLPIYSLKIHLSVILPCSTADSGVRSNQAHMLWIALQSPEVVGRAISSNGRVYWKCLTFQFNAVLVLHPSHKPIGIESAGRHDVTRMRTSPSWCRTSACHEVIQASFSRPGDMSIQRCDVTHTLTIQWCPMSACHDAFHASLSRHASRFLYAGQRHLVGNQGQCFIEVI